MKPNPNRHVLACLPLLPDGNGRFALPEGGKRAPGVARLPIGKKEGELAKTVKRDVHLGPFRKIPSKENGFDVEGIAAHGSRLLLGLRGPVLRGIAIVLELAVESKTDASWRCGRSAPTSATASTSSTLAAMACAISTGTATTS